MIFVYIPPPKSDGQSVVSVEDLPAPSRFVLFLCAWFLCGIVGAGFDLASRQARWPEQSQKCYMVDLHESSRNMKIAFGAASLVLVDHSKGWVFPFGLTCKGK